MSNQQIIRCLKCQGRVWKYGHDRLGRQRYRCVNLSKCGYQFTEGCNERKIHPKFICPKCGRRMEHFKRLSTCIRYRCSGRKIKGPLKCSHKVNVYLPNHKEYSSPYETELGQKFLALPGFDWPRMKFSAQTVMLCLYFSREICLPDETVAKIMKEIFSVKVSHDEINHWATKAAAILARAFKEVKFNLEGQTVHSDETVLKLGKKRVLRKNSKPHNKWQFFQNITSKTKVILGIWLSSKRDNDAVKNNFNTCRANSLTDPIKYVNDGFYSYGSAFPEVYEESKVERIVYQDFTDPINNNLVERQHGSIKFPMRRFRGFKSELGGFAFITFRVIYHNFFRRRKELHLMTPAEASGFRLPRGKTHWQSWLNS